MSSFGVYRIATTVDDMTIRHRNRTRLSGILKVRDHCLFTWRETEQGERIARVKMHHCAECIVALRNLGYFTLWIRTCDAPHNEH
jgi:hypothetical protein